MKKTNYETGQIPTVADMNAQHLLTEGAFTDLAIALTGGLSDVLLTDSPPSVTDLGVNWQISVPEQYAAINGRAFKVDSTQPLSPIADKQIGVYFILRQVPVVEARERLRDTGSTVVRESFNPTVRLEETTRVELTESGGATIAPPVPSLGPDDVGYLTYAVVISNGGVATINHNTAILWNFPGGGLAVGAHALTHMPTGSDPIPLAMLGGPSGSSAGLLAEGKLVIIEEAIQNVIASALSPYLVPVVSGDNTLTDPKKVSIQLRHHQSMEVKDVGGQAQLGVRFGSGPYDGSGEVAARRTHVHPIDESPITVGRLRVSIDDLNQLGSLIEVAPFEGISEIVSFEVYWAPPSFLLPKPGVQCGWVEIGTNQYVGVRGHLVTGNEIRLEIGNVGLTQMQDSLRDFITSRYTGDAITWDSATGNGSTPRNGELFIKVVGVRG
jgi:hypothetical protein